MSATYKCKQCGLNGSSKNIRTRSLFTDDMIASMLRNVVDVETVLDQETGRRAVTFSFRFMDTEKMASLPNSAIEIECAKMIQRLDDDNIVHWLCDHKWTQTGGEELQ